MEQNIIIPEGYELKKVDDFNYKIIKTIKTPILATTNLAVTEYRNGDPIPYARSEEQWARFGNANIGCYCWYDNDKSNKDHSGALYNWYAVNDKRGLAPVGQRIPTIDELKSLLVEVSNNDLGGWRYYDGNFYYEGRCAYFWSSSEVYSYDGLYLNIHSDGENVGMSGNLESSGFYVRCLIEE